MRRVADQHHPAPVPGALDQVPVEPGVVHPGSDRLPDLPPRAAVSGREPAHLVGEPRGVQLGPVPVPLDQVGVDGVRPGRAVPGDEAR